MNVTCHDDQSTGVVYYIFMLQLLLYYNGEKIRGRDNMGYLKKLPIRVQLSVLVIFIIVIVIFIIFTNYFKAANVVEKKNNEYFTEMISQMNQTLSSNSDVIKRIIQNISYNSPIVQQYLNETNPAEKFCTIYAAQKLYFRHD